MMIRKQFGIFFFSLAFLLSCIISANAEQPKRIAFIPKITTENFFIQAGKGAMEMGKQLGVEVTYDGPDVASVSEQANLINKYAEKGYDAIAISSVSPDGLNRVLQQVMEKGIKIITWDSDVNPQYRSFYIDQGTPDILGKMLIDMVADQVPANAQMAFFYSSPTVTDQNQWVKVAKDVIARKYPQWKIVTTQFGYMDPKRSLENAGEVIKTYPDLNGFICPDSTAFPAAAQAVENSGKSGKIAVTGFTTPSVIRPYIEKGVVKRGGLWDCVKQGALSIYVADMLLKGKSLKVGDEFDVPGIGRCKVSPNSDQGYDKSLDRSDSGIIMLPERLVFTKENVANYNF
ncbi:MAG: autoinducer 2 ABC transporter substrate-binding protein [Desulfobacteraceae bacterium IS3]|nr:MAG: autoinducer 2 ABC transporter substrate-binding protein [Desulfobacteraceae bacterium IS3]